MKPKPKLLIALLLLLISCKYVFSQEKQIQIPEFIQQSDLFLKSSYPPYTIESHVLGSLVGTARKIKSASLTPYSELNRIIYYESHNNPEAKNPNSSAYGYCQMINSTEEWVARDILQETGYVIDYNNPEDQLKACIYLYENGIPANEWLETQPLWNLNY